jgi:transposase-like protein
MHDVNAQPLLTEAPGLRADEATGRDWLTEILQNGAQRLLAQAIESEVEAWIERHAERVDDQGRRQVVRNGYLPSREIQTGIGAVSVRQPRVRDRSVGGAHPKFRSVILPPYLRRTKAMEELIPWLYLKGVGTGQFQEALQALVGMDAAGLSPSTITRLTIAWREDYKAWSRRSLEGKQYVYVWADGVHCNIRLEDAENQRQCMLVLMGATPQGKKELISVVEGYRESKQSWLEVLRDCRQRGLVIDPKLAVGDGALGFWSALAEVYPVTRAQRCWVHKTANVLNKLPKGVQGRAKPKLQAIWMADTKASAEQAFDAFVALYGAKYPKAAACLQQDREALLAFYDFPAEHWVHIRTTNPIESTFATVRHRHDRTKGSGSRMACLAMVFKLCQAAERYWRVLNGSELLPAVVAGIRFVDGVEKAAA